LPVMAVWIVNYWKRKCGVCVRAGWRVLMELEDESIPRAIKGNLH
jgi:hypothetical protein